jgi:hypothetical protein
MWQLPSNRWYYWLFAIPLYHIRVGFATLLLAQSIDFSRFKEGFTPAKFQYIMAYPIFQA